MSHRSRPTAVLASAAAIALAAVLALASPGAASSVSGTTTSKATSTSTSTYTNPVSSSFADTYADPAVIAGKDGWWYAYATADPLRRGDESGTGHITRTKDWRTWEYLGTIFDEGNRPAWAEPNAGLWAPDIRYIQGKYVLYYTVTDTTLNPGGDSAIGVATADAPAGPFIPLDEPIVAPRSNGDGGFLWTFDPAGFTSLDGRQWLYYGSYYGGVQVVEVSTDGLTRTGEPTQVTIGDRYEGAYVVERDGWYYLMGSSANCCAGPTTGYSVFAGRSKSPTGPFLDADGLDLNASTTGGTTVLTQNGNGWIGAGHHAVLTDTRGQDFIVYHALDKDDPWLDKPFGINKRPMLIDRLDWIDGWPRTNAGAGPSEGPQPLPATTSMLIGDPSDPASSFSGMSTGHHHQSGSTGVVRGVATSRTDAAEGALRVRLDHLADAQITLTLGRHPKQARITVDPVKGELRTELLMGNNRPAAVDTAPLRDGVGWRTLVVNVEGRTVNAAISTDDLNDAMASTRVSFAGFSLAAAPLVVRAPDAQIDNLFVQRPSPPVTDSAPVPVPGQVLWQETFDSGLNPAWTWVRPQESVSVRDGNLVWPLRSVDLVGGGNTGALLLRDMPAGEWILETHLTLDLGEQTVRNYQQAGLVVHRTDDDFARLGSVAIWNTRTVEFGRELAVGPSDPRTIYGGAIIGAPAPTMALRIAHSTNAEDEHVYRAGISRDGQNWVWGAAWTFPAGSDPRVGLYSGGGEQPPVSAVFHDVTLFRSAQ